MKLPAGGLVSDPSGRESLLHKVERVTELPLLPLALFSGLTANLASMLVKGNSARDKSIQHLAAQIGALREEVPSSRDPERKDTRKSPQPEEGRMP